MEKDKVYIIIQNIIKKILEKEILEISEESNLVDDLGLDSISLVYLQVDIEDVFDIRFDPFNEEYGEIFFTVDSLIKSICEKLDEV